MKKNEHTPLYFAKKIPSEQDAVLNQNDLEINKVRPGLKSQSDLVGTEAPSIHRPIQGTTSPKNRTVPPKSSTNK